ncbi:MAG: nucleotidyltransferase domain-containing protein [Phycisphaerae bacterium]|jgi:predicted nucleotidyltransferase
MRRSKRPIDFLIPRTRQAVLATMLAAPDRSWYRSSLAKHLGLQPSSLQRELDGLVRAGVLASRSEGNRTYFQVDPACPFLRDLQGLIDKTVGIAAELARLLDPFGDRVVVAFIFGSVSRGAERAESDVDLMVVGGVTLKDLVPALRHVETRLGRPVNVHTCTPRELVEHVRVRQHFITSVLAREKVFVKGSNHELVALLEPRKGRTSRDHASGS